MIYEQFLALTEADAPAKAGLFRRGLEKAKSAGRVVGQKAKSWSGYQDLKNFRGLKKAGYNADARRHLYKGLGKAGATAALATGLTAGTIALAKRRKQKKAEKNA